MRGCVVLDIVLITCNVIVGTEIGVGIWAVLIERHFVDEWEQEVAMRRDKATCTGLYRFTGLFARVEEFQGRQSITPERDR